MSLETGKISLGHICMDDGTEYDISLSYLSREGSILPCKEGFTLPPALLTQLQELIKTMATAHARKVGKSLHDLKIIQLNNLGATLNTQDTQSHDFDLTTSEKPLSLPTCSKVSDVWKKTSELLVQSYQEYHPAEKKTPEKAIETFSDPTTTITLTREDPPAYESPLPCSESTPLKENSKPASALQKFKNLAKTKVKNILSLEKVPSAPTEEDLGSAISEKITQELQTLQQGFIKSHLTPVTEPPATKPWYRRWDSTSPSEPKLVSLDNDSSFAEDLGNLIEEIVKTASDHGLQGQLQALGRSYENLLQHLTSIQEGESRQKTAIAQAFRKKANALTMEKAEKIKQGTSLPQKSLEDKLTSLLTLSKEASGGPLTQETPILTITSLKQPS